MTGRPWGGSAQQRKRGASGAKKGNVRIYVETIPPLIGATMYPCRLFEDNYRFIFAPPSARGTPLVSNTRRRPPSNDEFVRNRFGRSGNPNASGCPLNDGLPDPFGPRMLGGRVGHHQGPEAGRGARGENWGEGGS